MPKGLTITGAYYAALVEKTFQDIVMLLLIAMCRTARQRLIYVGKIHMKNIIFSVRDHPQLGNRLPRSLRFRPACPSSRCSPRFSLYRQPNEFLNDSGFLRHTLGQNIKSCVNLLWRDTTSNKLEAVMWFRVTFEGSWAASRRLSAGAAAATFGGTYAPCANFRCACTRRERALKRRPS